MRLRYFLLSSFVVVSGFLADASAFPTYPFWSPLGKETDMRGNFVNQVNLGDLDFGGGLVLPFTLDYSSKLRDDSPYFGRGWGCALLDSKAVEMNPQTIAVTMLGGKTIYLFKDRDSETIYHHSGGQWKGEKKGSLFRMSLPDGNGMEFINGQISMIKTREGRIIEWRRNGALVTEIGEKGKAALVKFEPGAGALKSLSVGGFKYNLTQDIISQGLQKIEWPNGMVSSFKRGTDDKGMPFMDWQHPNGKPHHATWDLVTGKIKTMDDWKYTVEAFTKKEDGKVVEDASRWPKLARENLKTKIKESYWYDNKNGITTRFKEGRLIKEYEFLSNGPLFRKIRKIEEVINGKTYIIERYAYNENGTLIKKILLDPRTGMDVTETFNEAGKPLQTVINGVVSETFTYNEQGTLLDRKSTPVFVNQGKGVAAGELMSVKETIKSKAGLNE
jgi:hypothetical protein